VIGGLLLSTFITLFVMPVMYSLIVRHDAPQASAESQ
jgi:Cu/Ag efflux pump CusA